MRTCPGVKTVLLPLVCLIAIQLQPVIAGEYQLHDSLAAKIDSMIEMDSLCVWANIVSTKPKVYFGATFATFPYSYETLQKKYHDYAFVTRHVRFARQLRPVQKKDARSKTKTVYLEAGNALVQSWVLLDVDSMFVSDDSVYTVVYGQNKDAYLNKLWRGKQDGFFVVENEDFNIVWYLKKLDSTHCRAGVAVWIDPRVYIPRWMYTFVAKRFLPTFLSDLLKGLEKEISQATTESP